VSIGFSDFVVAKGMRMHKALMFVIAVATLSAPAYASNCWINTIGDKIQFLANGENELTFDHIHGKPETCVWALADKTGWTIFCDEGSGISGHYEFMPATRDGRYRDYLLFNNDLWYPDRCPAK
jgi:hypothetical protein